MKIYIPTRGRVNDQITLRNIPWSWRERTTLVTHEGKDEYRQYTYPADGPGVFVLPVPERFNSIGKVRQYIVDWHEDNYAKRWGPKVLMLDDDLRFARRREDDTTKFVPATEKDVEQLFAYVEALLNSHRHCGILAREGANRVTGILKENTRLLRALAYDTGVLKKEGARFDRLIIMEDFDVGLQLLRRGYPNAAICNFVQDQAGSGKSGGCSDYRTLERQREGAVGLAGFHAPFVKLVTKTTKTGWEGLQNRTDVIVQWKAAFDSSKSTVCERNDRYLEKK